MDLYTEIILDHFKNPQNQGEIKNPTYQAKEANLTCGDEVKITLTVKNKVVKEARFIGEGCAISQAAADILLNHIKDKPLSEIKKLTSKDLFSLLAIDISPGRSKCALLALETLKKAIL